MYQARSLQILSYKEFAAILIVPEKDSSDMKILPSFRKILLLTTKYCQKAILKACVLSYLGIYLSAIKIIGRHGQQYDRNIERGETKLLSENVAKIAEALGVGTEELVLGYSSDRDGGNIMKDEKSYRWMYEELKSRYTFELQKQADEISRLVKENSTLKDYIEVQKNLISTKEEIISMLRKSEDE